MTAIQPTQSELQQIDQLLKEEEFRYQRLTLPGGRCTDGNDRSITLNLILPPDMSGKTLLDIGCRYGYFSFEAAKRGAARVLGVDFDDDALSKAHKLNAITKLNIEFRKLDISVDDIPEKFDFVLCLNILHHLQNPLGVLKKLINITKERLVLEIAGLNGEDAKKIFYRRNALTWLLYPLPLIQPLLNRLPLIVLGAENRAFESNFFFSPKAIRQLLLSQNNVFWKVETFASPFKGRFLCVAEKLRVKELLIVAGPSASGKSDLIKRLLKNKCPELEPLVGAENGQWLKSKHHIGTLPKPDVSKLVFHYDFLRPYLRGPFNFSRDRATDVFDLAETVRSVTLLTDPSELERRWRTREIEPNTYFGVHLGRKRSRKILKSLSDSGKVIQLYDRWIDFIRERRGQHYILDTRITPYRLLPLEEWPALRATLD
ncbi:MAG TPA: methyltransferase domain-containing protein [Aestuariivirgaceae bacterium]|jgi:2-polyprenyl-3-methyl-5-hydroxy-6-metoxy-1,4-benzoquinol methylase